MNKKKIIIILLIIIVLAPSVILIGSYNNTINSDNHNLSNASNE